MTPKEAAIRDYQSGDFSPDAPITFTHEQKAEYYKEFMQLIDNEESQELAEMRAGI